MSESRDMNVGKPPVCLCRRSFLKYTGFGGVMMGTPSVLAQTSGGNSSPANRRGTQPSEAQIIKPKDAILQLMTGNQRFVGGLSKPRDFLAQTKALPFNQEPFAAVLICSDARVSPEVIFDTGLGELFVVGVAGNIVTPEGLASLEYAVDILGVSLIFVLGHTRCGSIETVIEAVKGERELPGHMGSLVRYIEPAYQKVLKHEGNLLNNTISANILLSIEQLPASSKIISRNLKEETLAIHGGLYDLHSGKVSLQA
ncbi:carbonic anhydrase [Flexibacterium corallicola]|uniref:carbonic anhydrase n=1 Tax=Flexibacterium corallicola TaxID=3037259 RepID=UPI00286F2FEC|nr:carbonic anhydrase [Pseudovibrio sp. M1P-2-3]